jgi:hypothetical protein
LLFCVSAIASAPALAAPAARAGAPEILPLSAVRPGMTGYGLTVFQGTEPERFSVRIIGVLRQHLPSMDIILVKSDDPRVVHTGIAAGMSGSPIYVDGKLVGALAYGWQFSKDAIGGVTPIEYILKELDRPRRSTTAAVSPAATGGAGPDSFVAAMPDRRMLRAMLGERENAADERSPVLSRILPPGPPTIVAASASAFGEPRLYRAALPLSVAGLSDRAVQALRDVFGPLGMVPLQTGGAGPTPGTGRRGPERFEPGGALAVQLIRGDLSAAGTGTVTYVKGEQVAAFGHNMLNAGELAFPIATAEIFTILPSQISSFKMAAPLEEKGALLLDRQACIVGSTAEKAPTVAMQVSVRTSGASAAGAAAIGRSPLTEQVFRTELASHRFLTGALAQSVVTSALQVGAPDVTDAVIAVRSRLQVAGFSPLEQTDYFYSASGISDRLVAGSTGMKQLADLLSNPFAPVKIERLDLQIDVSYRAELAEIVSAQVPGDELEPDTRPSLQVTLRPYGGAPYVRAIPIEVPRWLAGQSLKIEVAAGSTVKPEVAPPETLGDLVENLRKGYSARSLVVTLHTLDDGVMLRGRLVPNLPASVIATLRPSGQSKRGEPYKRVGRVVVDVGTVLSGKQELVVQVKDNS